MVRWGSGFEGKERVAHDFEVPGVRFAAGSAECVNGLTNRHVDESAVLEESFPTCTRQAAGDSTGPQIDVPFRFVWNRLTVGDVGELDRSTRPQDSPGLGHRCGLIGAKVDDPV